MKRSKRHPSALRKPQTPRYLKMEVAATMVFAIVVLFAGAIALDRYIPKGGSSSVAAVIVSSLVELANKDRVASGLGELKVNPDLVAAAQAKANDMAQKGYFAHQSPEGLNPWHWFELEGYRYIYAGENLATDFSESGDVEEAWMKSPGHRENILNPHYSEIGIATAVGTFEGRERVYAVQMFGAPRPVSAKTPQKARVTPVVKPAQNMPQASAIPTNVLGETKGPVLVEGTNEEIMRKADIPFWAYAAANPRSSLRYAYYVIAALVLVLLALDTELELYWHHFKHAMRAGVLLATMSMLFLIANWVFFSNPVLAEATLFVFK